METDEITVKAKYFERIQKESHFLDCLRAAGVDNWSGYDDAREMWEQEYPEDFE